MTQTKALQPIDQVRGAIKAMEPQFKMALPSHVTVEKFSRTVMTAIQTTPALLSADRTSLFSACLKSASQGLLPDGKEAAFVTFRNKQGQDLVQYMPMISGLLKLVRNSGELMSITSQIVYEKDTFRYWIDQDGEHLNHEPNFFSDRGRAIGVYALAKTKDGGVYVEVLTEKQVGDVKNASRSKEYGPWSGAFAHEMWRKTAMRRLIKRLPLSTDIEMAIKADEDLFESEPIQQEPTREDQVQAAPKKKRSRLDAVVEANGPTEEPEKDVTPIIADDEIPL